MRSVEMLALDEAADHRDLAERALEEVRLLDPLDELALEDVGGKQWPRVLDRLEAVGGEGIIVGDEAERLQAGVLHPLGDQHAERLVRVPALEAVGAHVVAALAREGLDQQLVGLGEDRAALLNLEPFAHVVGEAVPVGGAGEEPADSVGEVGRHAHPLPAVGHQPRLLRRGADDDVGFLEAQHLEAEAGEEDVVADAERRAEAFLDPAEHPAIVETHVHHRVVDDHPGIEAVLGGGRRAGDAPLAGLEFDQPLELVVGAQRVAAGRDVIEHPAPHLVGEAAVGRRGADLGEQFGRIERTGAGDAHDVLGKRVERAGAEDLGVELACRDRVKRGLGLEIFEAIAGHDHAARRLVEAVIGAADPLQQARAALGRAHLDDEVDVAPVNAEVEAGGRNEGAQLARGHRRFDLAPRLEREAAVVNADRQAGLVGGPQFLEDQLGQAAGVAEHQGRLVTLDQLDHLARGVAAGVAAPRHLAFGDEDGEVGLGAGLPRDQPDRVNVAIGRKPGAVGVGVADRCAERDPAQRRAQRLEPRQSEREEVAALLAGEGVDLVDDDRVEVGEQCRAVRVGQQQAQRLRGGQQHLRRADPLARLAVGWGIAAAGLDPELEAHLVDRGEQVALDVDRERLQRRDVERVKPVGRPLDQVDQGRQEAGQRLAGSGRGDEQGVLAGAGGVEHRQLVGARAPAAAGKPALERGRKRLAQSSSVPSSCLFSSLR
jgi:hypothetical protein